MKKYLVALLSLGLVMAFSMSAFAVSADFTGQYYAVGDYQSNTKLGADQNVAGNNSNAYMQQRLRLFTRLKIAEGLTFTTRIDALETVWGRDQAPSTTNPALVNVDGKAFRDYNTANISFEQAWLTAATAIGTFDVGYKTGTPFTWGTGFMNAPGTAPGIRWSKDFGSLKLLADWHKTSKGDIATTGKPSLTASDMDADYYDLGVSSKFKNGDAGLLMTYFRDATLRGSATAGTLSTVVNFQPYAKMKLGNLDLEAEAYYITGKVKLEQGATTGQDQDVSAMGLYANAKFNMGPAFVGVIGAYASGQDKSKTDKITGKIQGDLGYGTDTNIWPVTTPLILFGYHYHGMGLSQYIPTSANDPKSKFDNAMLGMIYGGYAATNKLSFEAKYAYAKADQDGAATGWQSKNYGTEFDVKATYKIYDALTYNVGAAYLWTGDYFKGTVATAKVDNNYLITHWLDLTF